MAKSKNGDSNASNNSNARLETSSEDKVKAAKWFQRARELGEKRQFDYAIEYYVHGLEFWPDGVEEACKPLHGCAVARRQTGGKKPGLKDTMKRSMSDKNARQAFLNALWLFGHDPENVGFIDGVARNAARLRAEDAAKWSAAVFLKALESTPKANAKQFQTLTQLLEQMGDRAAERKEAPFAVDAFQLGVEVLNLWRRRIPKDDTVEGAVKNLSTKLTILKGKYQENGSYRESLQDTEEQRDIHDQQRSVQSDERLDELIAKAEKAFQQNPDQATSLRNLTDLLCRREQNEGELRAIGILVHQYKRTGEYRWKHSADDIRMKQLGRKTRDLVKQGDRNAIKEHKIAQLRFELSVFKERIERYPTDHRIRFAYGLRNFQAGRFDEAIPLFQAARVDPKNRAVCGMYLGRCFFRKGYQAQAISALQGAIEDHPLTDDELAKTMLYWLGRAQGSGGDQEAARKTYGRVLQIDYNYGDVRARIDALPAQG